MIIKVVTSAALTDDQLRGIADAVAALGWLPVATLEHVSDPQYQAQFRHLETSGGIVEASH